MILVYVFIIVIEFINQSIYTIVNSKKVLIIEVPVVMSKPILFCSFMYKSKKPQEN
jgi:hypothetical protein